VDSLKVLPFTFKPIYGFVLQGLVIAERDAGCAAAAAADTFFSIYIDGTLLVQDCADCTDRLCITGWAIMLADRINHNEYLLLSLFET
jgi:hypothetical protein